MVVVDVASAFLTSFVSLVCVQDLERLVEQICRCELLCAPVFRLRPCCLCARGCVGYVGVSLGRCSRGCVPRKLFTWVCP